MHVWKVLICFASLMSPLVAQEVKAEETSKKDCGKCGQKEQDDPFCICILEEVVNFGSFSLYDADRYEEACDGASCSSPTAVAHLSGSGMPDIPQNCGDEPKCGIDRSNIGDIGLDAPLIRNYQLNYVVDEDAIEIVEDKVLLCRGSSKIMRARIVLVKLLEHRDRPMPDRYFAFGHQVVWDSSSEPDYTTNEFKRVEGHDNLYSARVGSIVFHIVTAKEQP